MPNVMWAFGLYVPHDKDPSLPNLIGIVTYGMPASHTLCSGVCGEEYRDRVIELNRLVIREGSPKNSASKLVGASLKLLKYQSPLIIVSYADTKMSHIGYVYQATNWIYTGKTKPHKWGGVGDGHHRHANSDDALKPRSIKHRYVRFVGDRRQVRAMRKALNYEQQPYPKGDTARYKTNDQILQQGTLI
jgi:hypothetical protein